MLTTIATLIMIITRRRGSGPSVRLGGPGRSTEAAAARGGGGRSIAGRGPWLLSPAVDCSAARLSSTLWAYRAQSLGQLQLARQMPWCFMMAQLRDAQCYREPRPGSTSFPDQPPEFVWPVPHLRLPLNRANPARRRAGAAAAAAGGEVELEADLHWH